MPISFDLEGLRKTHNCSVYLETGLYDPTTNISCKKALQSNFDKVYSIEIRQDWIELGKKVFKNDIESTRLTLIHGDSSDLGNYINSDIFNAKTLFFLDAHVDNVNIHTYKTVCPVFNELQAISKLSRKDNVICIDDVRILKNNYPWNETAYGNINFIDKIIDEIRKINPDYVITYLDGHVKNDVLVAYIPDNNAYRSLKIHPLIRTKL